MYNRKLQHKFLRVQSATDDVDPLIEDEVPSDNEWVVEEDDDDGEGFADNGPRGDISQPSGSGKQKQKRSRATQKGKRIQSIVGETEWDDDSPSEGGEDDFINYDGGDHDDFQYDPHFQPLDTDDTIFAP